MKDEVLDMAKTDGVYARVEHEVKEEAEKILYSLGLSSSSAINMFYKQIILNKGLPFEVKIPSEYNILDMDHMSEKELNMEISKGYQDMKEGRVRKAEDVFKDIKKDYNL